MEDNYHLGDVQRLSTPQRGSGYPTITTKSAITIESLERSTVRRDHWGAALLSWNTYPHGVYCIYAISIQNKKKYILYRRRSLPRRIRSLYFRLSIVATASNIIALSVLTLHSGSWQLHVAPYRPHVIWMFRSITKQTDSCRVEAFWEQNKFIELA